MSKTTTTYESFIKNVRFQSSSLRNGPLRHQVRDLMRIRINPKAISKILFFSLGTLLTFFTFGGILLGYVRGYNRFMRPREEFPRLNNLPTVMYISMALGAVFTWVALALIGVFLFLFAGLIEGTGPLITGYFGINLMGSGIAYAVFRRWRQGVNELMLNVNKHASARFAEKHDLQPYIGKKGLYLGGGLAIDDKSHFLLLGGTRGGKFANILAANILRIAGYDGSFCIIDPKAEAAAVCAKALKEQGMNVVIINPWDLLTGLLPQSVNYNPLSLLSDISSMHLVDDVMIVCEMIMPVNHADHNKFFVDSARSVLAGLMLHLVTAPNVKERTLGELWSWCRRSGKDFDNMLADMAVSQDPVNGDVVRNAANELAAMMQSPETFSSIMSNLLEATSFLRSGKLRGALTNEFDPSVLAEGNTAVFINIPVDKLTSHAAWLRLVVTTMMRTVVRKPNKRVTFILDEAASLGKISEIPTALAAYAGFEISLWLVYQDLSQLKGTYGELWESIVANCGVRHYFSIKDNFTAKYVSEAMGETTRTVFSRDLFGFINKVESSSRALATPQEVTSMSADNMLLFIGEKPVAKVPKFPYYYQPELKNPDGSNRYDRNPYHKNSL